jgi:hypothetical protein
VAILLNLGLLVLLQEDYGLPKECTFREIQTFSFTLLITCPKGAYGCSAHAEQKLFPLSIFNMDIRVEESYMLPMIVLKRMPFGFSVTDLPVQPSNTLLRSCKSCGTFES